MSAHSLIIRVICFPLLVICVTAHAQSVYVPLDHWAYEFIERLETRGVILGALNASRPYSREEMARYLVQVEERIAEDATLTAVETRQLEFLRFEFKEEFQRLTGRNGTSYEPRLKRLREHTPFGKILPDFLYKNHRNLVSVAHGDFRLFVDPVFYQDWRIADADSIDHTDRVFERAHGFTLWGELGSHIGFFFDFRDTKEWGSRTYPRQFDISLEGRGFVNGYGTHIWHDETRAYMVFKLPRVQLILGKHANDWGPGYRGSLGLSDHATSYDQIKLQTRFWRLKFTYLWGFLRTFPVIRDADGGAKPKNLVAHRLDIDVARWLDVGLYEAVVFGNRRFELAYVNPINFYRSAEHHVGDNDNVVMGADFELLAIPNVKLYGEVLIDDLFTTRLGSGWFGNKLAFLTGALWVDAFTIPNLDARIEYARTRPYVYTHIDPINTYTHFSTVLGHWIGPNADDLYLRLQYRWSKSFWVAADFESYRHGANPADRNVGGDLNQPYPGQDTEIGFLDGIRERRNRFGVEARYELFRNFYVGLRLSTAASRNMRLPGGGRGPVERTEALVNVSLNR